MAHRVFYSICTRIFLATDSPLADAEKAFDAALEVPVYDDLVVVEFYLDDVDESLIASDLSYIMVLYRRDHLKRPDRFRSIPSRPLRRGGCPKTEAAPLS